MLLQVPDLSGSSAKETRQHIEATKDGITVDHALLIKVVLRLLQLSLLTWQLAK